LTRSRFLDLQRYCRRLTPAWRFLATFATVTPRDGEARRMAMLLAVPLDVIQGEAA
jgi:hypothetical protein